MFNEIKASFKEKPKFIVKLGTRNSFITNSFMKMRDVGVGLNYNDVVKVGVG